MTLIQTKYRTTRAGDLTDSSPDLWRTLRSWIATCQGNFTGKQFLLVTTAKAPAGAAASHLLPAKRNVERAVEMLEQAASASSNEANQPAYEAFVGLTGEQKAALLSRVTILDCSSNLTDLDNKIRKELFWTVKPKHLDSLQQRLEEWWYREVVKHLSSGEPIHGFDVRTQVDLLREQFQDENLPVDADVRLMQADDAFNDHRFVRQLDLIAISRARVHIAIRDYIQASEQRSRWVREDLLGPAELEMYEAKVSEEWEIHSEQVKATLGDGAMEDEKVRLAQELYSWAELADIPIRRYVKDRFITRGTFHILADHLRLGWHADWESMFTEAPSEGGRA